ncbi:MULTISPECIES: uroporphyrinogen decarboxylase [Halolamina]|uniref:Uroporphyrinogen decarboxylase n=1 Tax=Halolamina pelagica TaxID=699431 RepID=A0A1I5MAH8_9EURY|nr:MULTISPECIES: uroporphyrinogen decarboxylase [Halolamina]NHX35943.1 uroporphyrinogen decarboxylase [Halolamina sp. R1-12]SFP06594.1 uroporphyrinogen decarboxylase [Halolamina pelagica]
MTDPLLVRAARGERTERPPVWLMRQAGRHLPEYRDLREQYSFREAIETPEVAEEITLQPYDRYGVDGVVMFSDILTCLEPLGFDYHIESGVGPVIENPVEGPDDVARRRGDVREELGFVADLLDRLSGSVADEDAVLGFAGGPFTLASYVVAGGPDRGRKEVRKFRARHPEAFLELMERFAGVVAEYLRMQADHGADAVQLFDTYAGVLPPADYAEYVLPLHREIVESVDLPTVEFVRNMGGRLESLEATGADVVALDWTVDMATARAELGGTPVQGNLDPSLLYADPETVRERTAGIIEAAGPEGHILNLGHGVNRDTPIEGVEAFVETAKNWEWE